MSQEMYRKTQLASGKPRASKGLSFDMGRPQSNLGSRGRSPSLPGGGGGVDEWARKTQNVISGVKKGEVMKNHALEYWNGCGFND